MKKLIGAGLLALPLLVIGPNQVSAHNGGCMNLQGCFRLKICYSGFLKCWCEPFGPCCAPGGCGTGGGGYGGGGYAGCPGNDCSGMAPGPWYTYWPYNGQPYMTSPVDSPAWTYENHFQTPAPLGYPYWPASATPYAGTWGSGGGNQLPTTGFQPAGYYPSYWYGR